MKIRALILFAFLACAVRSHAEILVFGDGGRPGTVELSPTPPNWQFNITSGTGAYVQGFDGGVYYRDGIQVHIGAGLSNVHIDEYNSTGTLTGAANLSNAYGQKYFLHDDAYRLVIYVQANIPGGGYTSNSRTYYIGTAPPDKKLSVELKNTRDYPVKYIMSNAAGEILFVKTLQPGETFGQTLVFSPDTNLDGLEWEYFIPATFGDGGWVAVPGEPATSAGKTPATTPNTDATPPTQAVPEPTKAPGTGANSPVNSNNSSSVWDRNNATAATTDADRLDKKTFREGITKIENALGKSAGSTTTGANYTSVLNDIKTGTNGSKSTLDDIKEAINATGASSVTFDQTTAETTEFTKTKIMTALGKLPAAPTIIGPGSSESSFNWALSLPGIEGTTAFTVDLAPYSNGINIFKTLVRGGLTLLFFFASVTRIRGAFA